MSRSLADSKQLWSAAVVGLKTLTNVIEFFPPELFLFPWKRNSCFLLGLTELGFV